MTTAPPLPPSRKLVPTSQPINTLPTDVARLYTTIHPLLLLSLYYFAFPSLVSDPVLTLQNAVLPLSVLQLAYVVTCLPTSGSSPDIPPIPSKAAKSGQRKRPSPAKQNVGLGGKVVVSIPMHRNSRKDKDSPPRPIVFRRLAKCRNSQRSFPYSSPYSSPPRSSPSS